MVTGVRQTFRTLVVILQLHAGVPEIIVDPRDMETVIGQMTFLNCSVSDPSKGVRWHYYPVGAHRSTYIYFMGKMLQDYGNRARIERSANPGGFNLVLQAVQTSDAGKYVCQEDGDNGQYSYSELIVLDETPVCGSNITGDVIGSNSCGLDPDQIMLFCQATYHGNKPPVIKWKKDGKDLVSGKGVVISQRNYSNHVSTQLSVSVDFNDTGFKFTCETNRSAVEQYSCSKSLKILPGLDNFLTTEKKEGETATCLVNGSLPCTYKWIRDDNGREDVVSHKLNTTLSRSGLYRCEAECMIREKSCRLIAGQVRVASTPKEVSGAWFISGLSMLIISLLMVCVAVMLFCRLHSRKKFRRSMTSGMTKDESMKTRESPEDDSLPLSSVSVNGHYHQSSSDSYNLRHTVTDTT